MASYDVVIIGAGPGGYNAAIRCGQLGLKTAIVEKRSGGDGKVALGGTCLNVGCIPSKALLHASARFEEAAKHFAPIGIKASVELDLPAMLGHKDRTVTQLTQGVAFLMKKNKVDVVYGTGALEGPGRVKVAKADGTSQTLETTNVILATGSEVMPLPGVEVDEERVVSSTGGIALKAVPKRLIVIGGGYIGLELGSVWRRLGSEVTVVEYLDRITPGLDGEVSKEFQKILSRQGVKFRLGTKVTKAERAGDVVRLTVEPAAGGAPERSRRTWCCCRSAGVRIRRG